MKAAVLDASAVLALFEDRAGASKVRNLVEKSQTEGTVLWMSAVNWGEVYAVLWKHHGPERAREGIRSMTLLPVHVAPVGTDMAAAAAELHAGDKLPYADCFAAALAMGRKATLVTADTDFEAVEGRVRILWVR